MDDKNIEEDLIRVAEEEEKRLAEGKEKPRSRRKIRIRGKEVHIGSIIGGLFLALLIIVMVVPYYGIKEDPEPRNLPGKEVIPENIAYLAGINNSSAVKISREYRNNYLKMMLSDEAPIRNMASRIVAQSCPAVKVCQAKALFYWVRDNIEYVSDPPKGYLDNPYEVLYTGGADCDGLSILLANLLQAVGIRTRLAFIPNHVYVQVMIADAPKKYKEKDGWITLDSTCKRCEFGEVPISTWKEENKYYLYI